MKYDTFQNFHNKNAIQFAVLKLELNYEVASLWSQL